MKKPLSELWPVVRTLLKDHFSFNDIKDICSVSGWPVHELFRLSQRQGGRSNTKGELMDGLDDLFRQFDNLDQENIVIHCFQEMVTRQSACDSVFIDKAKRYLERFGWTVENNQIAPTNIISPIRLTAGLSEFQESIDKLLERYRNGDFNGCVTTLCSLIDDLTVEIWKASSTLNEQDHRKADFQQKVSKSIQALASRFDDLYSNMESTEKHIGKNLKGSITQAAGSLQSLRSTHSDAHGEKSSEALIVQQVLSLSLFVFSILHSLHHIEAGDVP